MRKILNAVGFGLLGLILLGFGLRIYVSIKANNAFLGVNYRGVPLGTYSSLATLVIVLLVLLVLAVQRLLSEIRRRR